MNLEFLFVDYQNNSGQQQFSGGRGGGGGGNEYELIVPCHVNGSPRVYISSTIT